MSSSIQTKGLVGLKEFPAISIILPVHVPESGFSHFRDRLAQAARNVEKRLADRYSKQKTSSLVNRLHHVINGIDITSTNQGIAIFVSDRVEKVFHLPFRAEEKLIIDDSFEVRDLIYAARLNRSYLLVLVSKNEVRTFMGYGSALVHFSMDGMPENLNDIKTEHSFPGWDYLDTRAYEEGNVNRFIHYIDTIIQKEMSGPEVPVILMGDSKVLGHFKKATKVSASVIDYIEGNFEHATKSRLLKLIAPSLQKLMLKEEASALEELALAVNRNQVSSGISQVWRTAAEARGRLLMVEKDYRETARLGEDGYTLIVDKDPSVVINKIEDAVDDIIEMVLNNKGDVVFVSDGALKAHNRIALINRY